MQTWTGPTIHPKNHLIRQPQTPAWRRELSGRDFDCGDDDDEEDISAMDQFLDVEMPA